MAQRPSGNFPEFRKAVAIQEPRFLARRFRLKSYSGNLASVWHLSWLFRKLARIRPRTTTRPGSKARTSEILTETLAKVAEPEPTIAQPQPVKIDCRDKTAFMVVMLGRPEGATLKEMAEALGWKENSIRGAMSLYAKKTKTTIASEKKDGVRTYYLK